MDSNFGAKEGIVVPDGVVDGIGEVADRVGGGGKIEMSGERGERAVRARVVVEHRRDLPRGAGAGHANAIGIPAGHGHAAQPHRSGSGDSRTERWLHGGHGRTRPLVFAWRRGRGSQNAAARGSGFRLCF